MCDRHIAHAIMFASFAYFLSLEAANLQLHDRWWLIIWASAGTRVPSAPLQASLDAFTRSKQRKPAAGPISQPICLLHNGCLIAVGCSSQSPRLLKLRFKLCAFINTYLFAATESITPVPRHLCLVSGTQHNGASLAGLMGVGMHPNR